MDWIIIYEDLEIWNTWRLNSSEFIVSLFIYTLEIDY